MDNPVCGVRFQRPVLKEESSTLNLPPRLLQFNNSITFCGKLPNITIHKTLSVTKLRKLLNEQRKTLLCFYSWSLGCKKKGAFKNLLSGFKCGSKSMFGGRSVMFTAGHKLTSSVDPKRDAAVALRQVRTFKAVFVLEPAVGRLFWR